MNYEAEVIFRSSMDHCKEKVDFEIVLVMIGESKDDVIRSIFQLLLTNYQKKDGIKYK